MYREKFDSKRLKLRLYRALPRQVIKIIFIITICWWSYTKKPYRTLLLLRTWKYSKNKLPHKRWKYNLKSYHLASKYKSRRLQKPYLLTSKYKNKHLQKPWKFRLKNYLLIIFPNHNRRQRKTINAHTVKMFTRQLRDYFYTKDTDIHRLIMIHSYY